MNPNVIGIALMVAVLRPRNNHARRNNTIVELLKLFGFFPDTRFYGVRMTDFLECDLERNLHTATHYQSQA